MGSEHVYCPELDNSKDLNKYIDQTIEGMRSGLFSFLAHPDLFMKGYKEWDEQSSSCLQAILDAAVDLNLPIEVNGLGMSRTPNETSHGMRYQYPYVEFWEMVSRTKVPVICNADAHDPHDVILNAQKARDFAGRFGIIPIATLNLQNN
jgi:histidinol-phosphatase (PHP family)